MSKIDVVRQSDRLVMNVPGKVGSGSAAGGGNSGFQALNLVGQFGVSKIIMVGFDMKQSNGVHWHGRHGKGLNNPNDAGLRAWRTALDRAAETFARYGIAVINASATSALAAFPKMALQEALEC